MAAIGVDFGNTYCRVGVFRSNAFEIIHSETQSRHIVSFKGSGTDMMVGDLAQNRVVENIETTFFCPKRLIGRTYEEITQQIGDNRWPFSVKEGGEKKPIFQVAYPDKKLDLHPIQIYSAVLYKARELATAILQENVVRAVITIPINCGKPFIEDAIRSAEIDGRIYGSESYRKASISDNSLQSYCSETHHAICYRSSSRRRIARRFCRKYFCKRYSTNFQRRRP